MQREITIYQTSSGKSPFLNWLYSLKDKVVRYRIESRIDRIRQGNYGDHKRFSGLIEIRMSFGKGYRLYCLEDGDRLLILLMGGDKSSQQEDVQDALKYKEDYYEQRYV